MPEGLNIVKSVSTTAEKMHETTCQYRYNSFSFLNLEFWNKNRYKLCVFTNWLNLKTNDMKNLLLLSTMIIALSCTTQRQNDLSNDQTIKESFNSTEINDLTKIQRFFDKSIGLTKSDKQEDLERVYTDFFLQNAYIEKISDFKLSINFNDQKELYNQLDQKTFNNIWTISWSTKWGSNDTLKHIKLNHQGKYVEFLKASGEHDSVINNYCNSLEIAGDISPTMVADLIKNYKNYKVNNPKIRLLIAIHYLTLNDQFERKEKY